MRGSGTQLTDPALHLYTHGGIVSVVPPPCLPCLVCKGLSSASIHHTLLPFPIFPAPRVQPPSQAIISSSPQQLAAGIVQTRCQVDNAHHQEEHNKAEENVPHTILALYGVVWYRGHW